MELINITLSEIVKSYDNPIFLLAKFEVGILVNLYCASHSRKKQILVHLSDRLSQSHSDRANSLAHYGRHTGSLAGQGE